MNRDLLHGFYLAGFHVDPAGGQQAEQGEAAGSLVPMFGIALFVIFALLAVPLHSYSQPLIIMSVIPFAFVGAIWGHVIMKYFGLLAGLSMPSTMGFIAASGVVVNSSLVLVHNVNQRRTTGEHFHEAVLHAAASRCRPIVLTLLVVPSGYIILEDIRRFLGRNNRVSNDTESENIR